MPLERLRRQELSPVAWEARSIERTAADSLDSIVNHRPGRLLSPVHRTGWAGWLGWLGWLDWLGWLTKWRVQRAGRFRVLRPRPSGLWGRSQ